MNTQIISGYKAFNRDLTCRDFHFEVGKTYTIEGDIEMCERGFHFCHRSPFDVLDYYGLIDNKGNMQRFAKVSSPISTSVFEGDKTVTAHITIEEELFLNNFIKEQVYRTIVASGNSSSSQLAASGERAKLAASGEHARLAASGFCAQLAASNTKAHLAASGEYTQLVANGSFSKLAASGEHARLAASGDYAQMAASGNFAKLKAAGKNSVITISGKNGKFKGINGTFVSCADFDDDGKCVGFVTGCIGKDGLKENTWYTVRNGKGKFIECEVQP